MWWSSFSNHKRDKKIKQEQEKSKQERVIEHQNQIVLREKGAQSKLQHYLSSSFTNKCVEIIKKKIDSKELLLNDLQLQIKDDGVFFGYSQYVSFSHSSSLIMFHDYKYNNLASEVDRDSFALAICSLLGTNFDVVYYVPYDREYDCNLTFIVSKQKTIYKNI